MSGNPRKQEIENEELMIELKTDINIDEESNDNINDEETDENNVDNHHEICQNNSNDDEDVDIDIDVNDSDANNVNDYDDHSSDDDDSLNGIFYRAMKRNKSTKNILNKIKLFPNEVSFRNHNGKHPLHFACICEYNYAAIKLIEAYPEAVRHQDVEESYPLHVAIRYSSDDVVMKLIEIFPDPVSISNQDGTLLHVACKRPIVSEIVVRKLIEMHPLALQEKDRLGVCPIYWLFGCNRPIGPIAAIKMLLDADPLGMQRRSEFAFNDTPFNHACREDNADVVQYLMQRLDLQIDVRDSSGRTPLHNACHHQQDKVVEVLLNHPDINVNALDCMNETPLHETVGSNEEYYIHPERRVMIVQKLLDHPFILTNQKRMDDKTPLDLIEDRLHRLEKLKAFSTSQEVELKCIIKMIHLIEEFQIKRRWQAYCYHLKNYLP